MYHTLDNSDMQKKESDKAADILKRAIFTPQPQTTLTAYPKTIISQEKVSSAVHFTHSLARTSTEKQTMHVGLAESIQKFEP